MVGERLLKERAAFTAGLFRDEREWLRMATKSVLKTIHIKDPKSAQRLTAALEHAAGKSYQEVRLSRSVSTASRDEIGKMFGGKK